MARSGIYVNGKEIVARYVGDKLVWKKILEKFWLSVPVSYTGFWSTEPTNSLASQMRELISRSIAAEDTEVDISKVVVGDKSWEAVKFGYFFHHLYGDMYYLYTRITFKNLADKMQFQQFMNQQTSDVTLNLYRKE